MFIKNNPSIYRIAGIFIVSLATAFSGASAQTLSRSLATPFPFSLGSVSGFADYHAHQMGQMGFGGRLMWGSHKGAESVAVRSCSGGNHAVSWLPIAGSLMGQPDLGMHHFKTHGYHSDSSKRYKHWPVWITTTHQGYWEGWLKKAHQDGMRLFVMSAVNFDMFCAILPKNNTNSEVLADLLANPQDQSKQCDDMVNIKRQLRAAHDFAAKNASWYQIAETPQEARSIIQQGKMAVILAVEASKIWGSKSDNSWANVKARLDTLQNLGVRSFQIVHEIDNNVGGPAFFHVMFDIFTFIDNAITNAPSILKGNVSALKNITAIQKDSRKHNVRGLTSLGDQLVRELMARKMIVDVAHLSERGTNSVYNIARQNKYYPMFVSHAHFRDLFYEKKADEKKLPYYTVQKVKQTGGVIGLRTGPDRVKTYNPAGVANNCHGSSRSFAQSYVLGTSGYGAKLGFGLDMTGMIAQARPRFYSGSSKWSGTVGVNAPITWACGATKVKSERQSGQSAQGSRSNGLNNDYDLIGLAHVGHTKNLIRDLNKLGVQTHVLENAAENFVQMWERIHNPNRRALSNSVSNSGIDHSSYTEACPMAVPVTGPRREKVGTKYKNTSYGVQNYVSVCKAWPHTNIQNRNCSSYGTKYNGWCIKSRDGGKWYSARKLIEDKCPVPHSKIGGVYKSGKIVCQSNWDPTIQRHNCSGSGKYKWGNYCVVAESSYHVRVRRLVRDKCPVPYRFVFEASGNKIVCKPTPHFKIKSRKCSGWKHNGWCLWNQGWWYKGRQLK